MAFEKPVITYNGYTLGMPVGQYKTQRSGREFRFSQDFLIAADDTTNTAALFNTACTAAEVALNNANGALSVTWEGQTLYSFAPASNTGLLTRGEVIKRGDIQYDQERSRLYTFNFTCQLPASEFRTDASELGYFETNVSMVADVTGRPTFIFTGEYRSEKDLDGGGMVGAIGLYQESSNGAKAKAVAWLTTNAGTWAGSSYYNLSGNNYELIEETVPGLGQGDTSGTIDIITPYRLVYRFRAIPELAAGTGTVDYVVESLLVTSIRDRGMGKWVNVPYGGGGGGGDAPAGQSQQSVAAFSFGGPSLMFQIAFEVACPFATSRDWDNLHALYTGSIKPFLRQHLSEVYPAALGTGSEPWELQTESTPIRTDANRISVSWLVRVPNEQNFLTLNYALTLIVDHRNIFHKLGDGQADTWDEHSPGPAKFLIQRATGTILREGLSPVDIFQLIPPPGGAWRKTGRDESTAASMTTQDTQGANITLVDFQVLRMYQYNTKQKAGTGVQLTAG